MLFYIFANDQGMKLTISRTSCDSRRLPVEELSNRFGN
jgi:hypothetical protein